MNFLSPLADGASWTASQPSSSSSSSSSSSTNARRTHNPGEGERSSGGGSTSAHPPPSTTTASSYFASIASSFTGGGGGQQRHQTTTTTTTTTTTNTATTPTREGSAPPPKPQKHTRQFTKKIERVILSAKEDLTLKGALLSELNEIVSASNEAFENCAWESQRDLLLLWDFCLAYGSNAEAPHTYRDMAISLAANIAMRKDFSLANLSREANARAEYVRLLLASFDTAGEIVRTNSKSTSEMQFACRMLVLFFFRLPKVSAAVLDALQAKPREVRDGFGYKPVPRDVGRRLLFSSSVSRTLPATDDDGNDERNNSNGSWRANVAGRRRSRGTGSEEKNESGVAGVESSQISTVYGTTTTTGRRPPRDARLSPKKQQTQRLNALKASLYDAHGKKYVPVSPSSQKSKMAGNAALVDEEDGVGVKGEEEEQGDEPRDTRDNLKRATPFLPPASPHEEHVFLETHAELFEWPSLVVSDDESARAVASLATSGSGGGMRSRRLQELARWIAHKDSFFLTFFEYFVQYVGFRTGIVASSSSTPSLASNAASSSSSSTRSKTPTGGEVKIVWSLVPGYELMLECFFPLLRSAIWWDSVAKRSHDQGIGWVTSLPGYMKVKRTAVAALAADPDLLTPFAQTAFECTNVHSLLSVDSGVEHLNLFFNSAAIPLHKSASYLANHNNSNGNRWDGASPSSTGGDYRPPIDPSHVTLPDSFARYDDFYTHFRVLLVQESFQVLLKCCSFLYNSLGLFRGRNRVRLVNDLLLHPPIFFHLFLHWSPEVRTCFHHVIVYKVLRADRRYLPCFSDSQVMLLYGTAKDKAPVSEKRVEISTRAAWGKSTTRDRGRVMGDANGESSLTTTAEDSRGQKNDHNIAQSPHADGLASSNDNIGDVKKINGGEEAENETDAASFATPAEIAQLTRSAERRLAIFDRSNALDDEELLNDMAFSSKIDSFVRMCQESPGSQASSSGRRGTGGGGGAHFDFNRTYVEPALEQYALLLIRYYRGVTLKSLQDIPLTLSHRMIFSEFNSAGEGVGSNII